MYKTRRILTKNKLNDKLDDTQNTEYLGECQVH